MFCFSAFVALSFQLPTLNDVYATVAKLKGIEIRAEAIRPSSILTSYKIAPGGAMVATYPTSVSYINIKEQITWFPDRREFSTAKAPTYNLLPGGFESMWPKGELLTQTGPAANAVFAGKPAIEIPCRASAGHSIRVFVNEKTLIPVGTIALSQGTEYEFRYTSTIEKPFKLEELKFVPPADARPFRPFRPIAPDANLIKSGTKLADFAGRDLSGNPTSR